MMPEITGSLLDKDEDQLTPIGTAQLQPLQFNVIDGTDGPDELVGTPEDDLIRGFGGDDDISGRGGNDELHGNAGNDVIRGQGGDDVIFGGSGDDELRGGDGNDDIRGGAGNDLIFGGDGDDELRGGAGKDVIQGGPGNDVIIGGAGADELRGGAGSDEIQGGLGHDVIFGGAGADELRGGQGNDVIQGGPGKDVIFGGAGNDELRGGPGDDELHGGAGDDTIFGGAGNDLIDGGPGLNVLTGGADADTFRFSVIPVDEADVDQILDFKPDEGDTLDIGAIVDFEPGDDVDDFVLFEQDEQDTLVSIDPEGTGANFTPLVLLVGAEIQSLTLAQLGLTGGPVVTERMIASTDAGGSEGNGVSFVPSLSGNGRFITFASSATNFIDGDDDTFDVFVKDLQTGTIERVSQTEEGVGGEAGSFFSSISADGGRVAFDSLADNFPGDLNFSLDNADVFVADLSDGSIQFVSIDGNQFATFPSISADGTRIAFQATATGRAETPEAEGPIIQRIYVRDLDGTLREASTASDGEIADGLSRFSDISADGRYVAFDSEATNLHLGDTNDVSDIFRKNLEDGSIELVSVTALGQQDDRGSVAPSISGDGRFVAFQTTARLVEDDPEEDNLRDIYVKDMNTGDIFLVSTSAAGTKGNADSFSPSISDDGNLVAFRSAADNLVEGDDNGVHDIFVKNLTTGDILRFEVDGDTSDVALPQGIMTLRPSLSGDGSTVAFSDQVEITEAGGIGASQVVVAPVDFGLGPVAAGGIGLESLLAPDDVAAV